MTLLKGLVAVGSVLERSRVSPFWGGLILAFGEAALVGGLADWFAVRALFTHPLGIRIFPHTALIPRNRARIVREISNLVQNEWLTKEMMLNRIDAFDFVGDGLLSLVAALKPKLRPVLRTIAREVLTEASPQELAGFLSQATTQSLDAHKVAPFLAEQRELAAQIKAESRLAPAMLDGTGVDERVHIRGVAKAPGEPASRRFHI